MRIKAFELKEPLPELRNPHVIATLSPWVDAGNVGTLALSRLKSNLKAKELGSLAKPGQFFDFTRYRPTIHYVEDRRVFTLPNSTVSYALRPEGTDLLFFNVLEPHACSEEYVESILELLGVLGVKGHCRVGAMYGAVPHTRRLPISYAVGGQQIDLKTGQPALPRSRYEGPTSAMYLLTEELEKLGVENTSLMLQLPYYAKLEEDYTGVWVLLEALCKIHDLSRELADTILGDKARGERQYRELSAQLDSDSDARGVIQRLEAEYDAAEASASQADDTPALSPEIERFLGEINRRLKQGGLDS